MTDLLHKAKECVNALHGADKSFQTYADVVKELVKKVKKTNDLEMKNATLHSENTQLKIDIGKCNEDIETINQLHEKQIHNKENEISKLETTINELNLEDKEEMEYIATTLAKIQKETDINKTKPMINMILKRMPTSKKGGNPRKTRKQKKHKNKRSTYTLNKMVKKLFQIRL